MTDPYSFYILAENPDIGGCLREEIYEILGKTGRPTYDQIRGVKYMRVLMVCIRICVLTKTSLLKTFCRRGPKAVSSGVSFFLFHKTMLMLMSATVRLIAGTFGHPNL